MDFSFFWWRPNTIKWIQICGDLQRENTAISWMMNAEQINEPDGKENSRSPLVLKHLALHYLSARTSRLLFAPSRAWLRWEAEVCLFGLRPPHTTSHKSERREKRWERAIARRSNEDLEEKELPEVERLVLRSASALLTKPAGEFLLLFEPPQSTTSRQESICKESSEGLLCTFISWFNYDKGLFSGLSDTSAWAAAAGDAARTHTSTRCSPQTSAPLSVCQKLDSTILPSVYKSLNGSWPKYISDPRPAASTPPTPGSPGLSCSSICF